MIYAYLGEVITPQGEWKHGRILSPRGEAESWSWMPAEHTYCKGRDLQPGDLAETASGVFVFVCWADESYLVCLTLDGTYHEWSVQKYMYRVWTCTPFHRSHVHVQNEALSWKILPCD